VEVIVTALANDIHCATAGAAEASVIRCGHHVYFLNAVDIRRDGPLAGAMVVVAELARNICAVQGELVVANDAAAQRVGVRDVPSAGAGVASGAGLAGHLATGCRADEYIRLSTIEGHIFEFTLADDGATRGCGRFQLRGRCRHFDGLASAADGEGEVLVEGLRGEKGDLVLLIGFEALGFSDDGVVAGQDVVDVVDALSGCGSFVGRAGGDVGRCNGCAGDESSGGVTDLTGERGAKLLCVAGKC
jgi:hypothetical protein